MKTDARSLGVRFIKLIVPHPIATAQETVRWLAARRWARTVLNRGYALLSSNAKREAHGLFSRLFRGYSGTFADGVWRVGFEGRRIVVPLRADWAWLDWDFALALLGHDADVTRLCGFMIRHARPRVVFDVGSNYGIFSLRWLVHGVRTISFEPNPVCNAYLRLLGDKNQIQPEIEELALDAEDATVSLFFTPGVEWLGTTRPRNDGFARRVEVRQGTVDGYVEEHQVIPDLLKVDTEGSDLGVLRGASRTLWTHRPLVVFESLDRAERHEYFDLLTRVEYVVCPLDVPHRPPRALDSARFGASADRNFLACPTEMLTRWPPRFG